MKGGSSAAKEVGDPANYLITSENGSAVLRIDLYTPKVVRQKHLIGDLTLTMAEEGASVRSETWYRLETNESLISESKIRENIDFMLTNIVGYDRKIMSKYVGLVASANFVLFERCLERLRQQSTNSEATQLICQIAMSAAWASNFTTGLGVATSGSLYNAPTACCAGRPGILMSPLAPVVLNDALKIFDFDLKSFETLGSDAKEIALFGKSLAKKHFDESQAKLTKRRLKEVKPAAVICCPLSSCACTFPPPNAEFGALSLEQQKKSPLNPLIEYNNHLAANPDHLVEGPITYADSMVFAVKKIMARESLNPMQQLAATNLIEQVNDVFLSGPAGTGKTTLINFVGRAKQACHGWKSVVFLALTGAAASVMKTTPSARTVHSFFGLDKMDLRNVSEETIDRLARRLKEMDDFFCILSFFIDEVSMMSDQMYDVIDRILQRARGNNRPHGDIQMILSGDMMQLEIVRDKSSVNAAPLRNLFESATFEANFPADLNHRVFLTDVMRQKDAKFCMFLSRLRVG
jgi:hypothetical protein